MAKHNIVTKQVLANTVGVLANQVLAYKPDCELILLNLSTNTVYYGSNATANATAGALLRVSNSTISYPETHLECSANIYLMCVSGTSLVAVTQIW